MRLHLITVGSPRLAYAKAGVEEYAGRLKRHFRLRLTHLPGGTPEREGEAMLAAAGRAPLWALDPRGKGLTSGELAALLRDSGLHGEGELAFGIGGPDGHSDALRERARGLIKLSDLILPHDLAMVLTLEALYRAGTINRGEPYHRGAR